MNPIVLCAALPDEVKPLCRRLGIVVPTENQPISEGISRDGCAVRVAVSGIGQVRMAQLVQAMPLSPVLGWVSIGFAGGLASKLSVGDCIIGHKVVWEQGDFCFGNESLPSESCLADSLYCSEEAVCTLEEKRTLFQKTGAMAVDMESLAVARVAQSRGEPFTWIRVISDTARETIPPAVGQCIGPMGFPSWIAGMKALLSNPTMLPFMIRFGLRSKKCATRLAEAVIPWLLLYHSPMAHSDHRY